MAWFIVDITYTDDRELLLSVRPRHRDYLVGLVESGAVVAAGPWGDDLGSSTVFQVEDRAALDELIARDPYTTDGVAAARTVREWKPIFGAFAQ